MEEHREAFDVVMMCRVLKVSRSGYYKWRSRPGGERRLAEGRRLLEIRAVHRESRGARPTTARAVGIAAEARQQLASNLSLGSAFDATDDDLGMGADEAAG